MRFESPKCVKNAFAAGALTQTPLGELTALPRPRTWIWGRIWEGKEKGGEGMEGRQQCPRTNSFYAYLQVE